MPAAGNETVDRVAFFVGTRRVYERISSAPQALGAVRFYPTEERVVHELLQVSPRAARSVLLIDPRDSQGHSTVPIVSSVRRALPALPILACFEVRPGCSMELLELLYAGADEFALVGVDDIAGCAGMRMPCPSPGEEIGALLAELSGTITPAVIALLQACLTTASLKEGVEALAMRSLVTRRSLVNRFRGQGLPPPSRLISWPCHSVIPGRAAQ